MDELHRPSKEPLTVGEAAEELGLSDTFVRDLIDNGQLVAYRYGPRKTVIYWEDLQTFKQSRRVAAPNKKEAS